MPQTDITTNEKHLTTQMYVTEDHLMTRIRTHELYTYPKQDFTAWVLDHITWRGDEIVLDVGCGAGLYIEPVATRLTSGGFLISADLSFGMLSDVAAKPFASSTNLLNANVLRLPLPDDCCDVVMANHMLYHVPDISSAVIEIRRVLRPGGYFIAATNSRYSMQEFVTEITDACHALGYNIQLPPSPSRLNFSLENGAEIIRLIFPNAEIRQFNSALIFPTAEPAAAYINSLRSFYEAQFPQRLSWPAMMQQVERQIAASLTQHGEYRVAKTTGIFLTQHEG
ncbi:MAG: methyltransferase domain-containing protein [Chloroflexi bacterium]|nr:methyltransferase domain-containing protein [Chloroflexota bacterium]